jgi:hypothetical protein
MSANLDLVRSIFADWEHGEFNSLGWAHAEIEFVVADGPEPKSLRGLRAMLQYWGEFLRSWGGGRILLEGCRELGEQRVLALMREGDTGESAGRGSGSAQILDIHDGMVTRMASYFDRERALAELGLAPEARDAVSATIS